MLKSVVDKVTMSSSIRLRVGFLDDNYELYTYTAVNGQYNLLRNIYHFPQINVKANLFVVSYPAPSNANSEKRGLGTRLVCL